MKSATRTHLAFLLLAAGALRAADPDLVFMQQIVVEAAQADWKYVACPGYELLSRCDEADTDWFATGFFRSVLLQDELVPPNYLPPPTVPLTAILYDRIPAVNGAGSTLVPPPMAVAPAKGPSWGGLQNVKILSGQVLAQDRDTVALATNLWGGRKRVRPESPPVIIDGGLFSPRLLRRGPVPPLWYRAGLTQPFGLARAIPTPGGMLVPGALWVSTTEARTGLLPLSEIFRERSAEEGAPSRLWLAEAALLVRWAYSAPPAEPEHRLELFRLLARAESEPVTEAVFRQCFGFGYAEMQSRLAAYLPRATTELLHVGYRSIPQWPPAQPKWVRHLATDVEVARIIGDWERMTGVQLLSRRPELARIYLEHAGNTLRRPYARGSRDPQLMALLGLYYFDIGDKTQARDLLDGAVKNGAVRPAARRVLAQLRPADTEEHPGRAPPFPRP